MDPHRRRLAVEGVTTAAAVSGCAGARLEEIFVEMLLLDDVLGKDFFAC